MKEAEVKIYNIKRDAEYARYLMYASLKEVKDCDLEVKKENYQQIYETTVKVEENDIESSLEDFFATVQWVKLEGWEGHSLSVSDIIEVDGVDFYVDEYRIVRL